MTPATARFSSDCNLSEYSASSDPVIADIALGELTVPEGQTMLEALSGDKLPPRAPEAEWYSAQQAVSLGDDRSAKSAPDKRDGLLRLQASDDVTTRGAIEEALESHTKRWALQDGGVDQEGRPELTYAVRLKKRAPSELLLEALRGRLGEQPSSGASIRFGDRHGPLRAPQPGPSAPGRLGGHRAGR